MVQRIRTVLSRRSRWISTLLLVTSALLLIAAGEGDKPTEEPAFRPPLGKAAKKTPAKKPPATPPAKPAAGKSAVAGAYLVPVKLPISGDVDMQIKGRIEHLLSSLPAGARRPLLVLEFKENKENRGAGSNFGRSYSLADYISGPELAGVRTVAYLPQPVEGHAVLAVLACEEIIMSPAAELGRAGVDGGFIDAVKRSGYTEIAGRRNGAPGGLALSMLDASMQLSHVETLTGPKFVTASELPAIKKAGAVKSITTVSEAGELGNYTAAELRKFHIVSRLASDRRELAVKLSLKPGALQESASLGGDWRAVRAMIDGPVRQQNVSWVQRSLEDAVRSRDVNYIVIWIDSPGGSPAASLQFARYLASLDSSRIRTVAFVPFEARADAALIALACDELVVGEDATLGGDGAYHIRRRERESLRPAITELALAKDRDWSLMAAMVQPGLEIARYRHRTTGVERLLCEDEYNADARRDQWEKGELVEVQAGLTGAQALALGVAKSTARDFEEFKSAESLTVEPIAIEANWAHRLIEYMSAPWIARLLLFMGIMLMLAEFSQPGLSVAGFLSGLCFVLFFWSQALHGTAGWLEIMLFVAGVVSLLLEIFVVPGFGIFGIGGMLLMVTSVVLASQTFIIPQNDYQLRQLPVSLSFIIAGLFGAGVGIFLIRRFLPHTPMFRHIVLAPAQGEDLEEQEQREALADLGYLRGKRGVAATQLTPSGKARFGDDVIAVISDSQLVDKGAAIYVADVTGTRVLVKPVEE